MVKALIHQPAKTAMQSGRGKSKKWVVEFPRSRKVAPEPLMGWQSSADTARQVKLTFQTKQAAIEYCEARNISYHLSEARSRNVKTKAYADNFASDRVFSWTH